jgi:effector-binding domain-containing protein
MLKIGDFSKLGQVSLKTLRFYDEMGLLKPAHVDESSGYRYYAVSQLPRLNRILALKDLGFALEQIASLLQADLPAEQLRGMLRLKQAQIQQQMRAEQDLLARLEARLRHIEREGTASDYDVVIKSVKPIKVALVRDILPAYPEIVRLRNEVYAYLRSAGLKPAGPWGAIWHENEYKERDVDATGYVPVGGDAPAAERVALATLPAETMASVIHQGRYSDLVHAYAAIPARIESNGYRIVGYNREIYLEGSDAYDDPASVTEIQFPVAKV